MTQIIQDPDGTWLYMSDIGWGMAHYSCAFPTRRAAVRDARQVQAAQRREWRKTDRALRKANRQLTKHLRKETTK